MTGLDKAADTANAWKDGPYLVVRKKGSVLPDRCIFCGEPAEGQRLRFTIREHPSSDLLTFFWLLNLHILDHVYMNRGKWFWRGKWGLNS
jgi:hypothetical protein